jgi:thymidylate synthase (FAD)
MRVTLLHYTPLWVCAKAIRTCWDSHSKSDSNNEICGEKDRELIERVGNKNRHSSTLEHLVMSYKIEGISRACLQELARHRMASLSVKSTRYTLKELKNEQEIDREIAKKYIVFTENEDVDNNNIASLENLRKLLLLNLANDIVKFSLPECYKTELVWTINVRSLQNFLTLRGAPSALWEIRELSFEISKAMPEEYKYLFENSDIDAKH